MTNSFGDKGIVDLILYGLYTSYIPETDSYFPGKYSAEKLTEAVADISSLLGGIFRLRLGGSDIVFTTDADYTEKLIRNEGVRPNRPTFPALYKFRKETFDSVGVVPGNGEEWYKLRSSVLPLLKPPLLEKYKSRQKVVADSFVTYIQQNRDSNNYLNDVWNHLIKFAIESKEMNLS